jgi:hypothetical protein
MTLLFDKDNLLIFKYDECNFLFQCRVSNPRLDIPKIFTFDWLKVIFELHGDFIEKYEIFQEDENTAKVFVLLRHFFKDFGIPQLFFFIHVKMDKSPNKIIIYQTNETNIELLNVKKEYLHVPVNDSRGDVVLSQSTAFIEAVVKFQYFIPQTEFIEKMGLILCTKVLLKTKQFIENL